MYTVIWKVQIEGQEFVASDPEIIGGTLPDEARKRHFDLIYGGPYPLGDHYFDDFIADLPDMITAAFEDGKEYCLTIQIGEDWAVPDGTPDELIEVSGPDGVLWANQATNSASALDPVQS